MVKGPEGGRGGGNPMAGLILPIEGNAISIDHLSRAVYLNSTLH
jgi:hypothetical protein